MTRTFRILNTNETAPLIITQLVQPDHPITLDAGREIHLSVHSSNLAVVIGKQKLSDIEHAEFSGRGVVGIGVNEGQIALLEAELDALRLANAELATDPRLLLSDEDMAFLASRTVGGVVGYADVAAALNPDGQPDGPGTPGEDLPTEPPKPPEPAKPLDKMTKAELLAVASLIQGIEDVGEGSTKAQIIEAIRAATE